MYEIHIGNEYKIRKKIPFGEDEIVTAKVIDIYFEAFLTGWKTKVKVQNSGSDIVKTYFANDFLSLIADENE